ncbi:ABC transporter [Pseudoxanthomonas suwonensis]|jgi:ABC-type uncharacterized transport system, auxiliary component|nr:ABC-type transport auxiliary lipoprotein family protein [Pseudoxanthomonas suwonensis]KAF1704369.1 ABC transporter [Pseudoxanthomonas suwonensis]
MMPAPAARPATAARLLSLLVLGAALAGCAFGGKRGDAVTIYAPEATATPDPSWPKVDWQLAIARPSAPRLLDTPRIGVRPVPGELQVYKGAAWAQPPTDMLEASVLRVLEDSGKIDAVGRLATGLRANYRLALDIRHFEADYRGGEHPVAVIEVAAKLMHNIDQRVVASRSFARAQPASAASTASVAAAFDQALAGLSREIAGWTLAEGQADAQRRAAP